MPTKIKKALMMASGVVFVNLGFVGLALPFLQGFLFLAIGVVLLSLSSSRIRTWIEVRTRPYPKIHHFVERTQEWVIRIIGPTE
jgi:uncharacterized membrane protein YbaN (DUF454 family)